MPEGDTVPGKSTNTKYSNWLEIDWYVFFELDDHGERIKDTRIRSAHHKFGEDGVGIEIGLEPGSDAAIKLNGLAQHDPRAFGWQLGSITLEVVSARQLLRRIKLNKPWMSLVSSRLDRWNFVFIERSGKEWVRE
jgi:hypothetical protein